MTKFNPNVFKGPRIRIALSGYSGISRIWVWDENKKKYEVPTRGLTYVARRSGSKSRSTKAFATREDACNWLRGGVQVANQTSHPTTQPLHRTGAYSMRDLFCDWQRLAWPSFRESTRIYYSKVVVLFAPLLDVEVESMSAGAIDEWIAAIKGPEYEHRIRSTRKSLAKELETLKTVLNWYRERTDDTKLVMPIKKRHYQMAVIREAAGKNSSYMTEPEFQQWLEVLKGDSPMFHSLAVLQTRQLLRISEACAMKWSNLDLSNRTYRLCEHVIWPRIGGRKPIILAGTKNMRAGEVIHLPLRQDVANLLRDMKEAASCDLIFHDQGEVLTYRQVQHRYNHAFKKAGLPYASTHICRHTGATAFLNETGDFLALQQMGNWADLKVALHYGKIMGSRAKEAVEKAEKPKLKLVKEDAG